MQPEHAAARLAAATERVRRELTCPVQEHVCPAARPVYVQTGIQRHDLYYAAGAGAYERLKAYLRARLHESTLPAIGGSTLLYAPPAVGWHGEATLAAKVNHAVAGEWLVLAEAARRCGMALMTPLRAEMETMHAASAADAGYVELMRFALLIAALKRHYVPRMQLVEKQCLVSAVICGLSDAPVAETEGNLQRLCTLLDRLTARYAQHVAAADA